MNVYYNYSNVESMQVDPHECLDLQKGINEFINFKKLHIKKDNGHIYDFYNTVVALFKACGWLCRSVPSHDLQQAKHVSSLMNTQRI